MGRTPQGGDCRSHTTHVFYVDRHRQTALREAAAASSACGSRRRKIHKGLSPWRSRTPARWPCLVSPPSDTVKGCLDAHPGIGYHLSSFRTSHPGPRAAAHRASGSDKPQVPPGLRSLACFTLPVVRSLLQPPHWLFSSPGRKDLHLPVHLRAGSACQTGSRLLGSPGRALGPHQAHRTV